MKKLIACWLSIIVLVLAGTVVQGAVVRRDDTDRLGSVRMPGGWSSDGARTQRDTLARVLCALADDPAQQQRLLAEVLGELFPGSSDPAIVALLREARSARLTVANYLFCQR